MIKINLLPPHIHQRKQVKIAVGIVVVMLAAEIGGVLAYRQGPLKTNEELTKTDSDRKAALQQVQSVGTQASAVLGGEAALGPKYNFITGMLAYNKLYPDLYARTAQYAYREATFLNLEASANQLKFDAYVSDPADVARLMVGLSNSPDFANLPQISGVPDYNSAERKKRDETLNSANLPDTMIIGGQVAGAGGAGGYPGAPGGYPGGYPGGMMGAPGSEGSYPGGSGGPGGYPGGMMGAPSMGGYPGGEGGGGMGGGGGNINLLRLDTSKKKPRGFTVTVTCALRTPISRPTYADSESQLGGSGGGGGMGGYPGMSGYPGGMSGYPGGSGGAPVAH